jgi:hypothetical protein
VAVDAGVGLVVVDGFNDIDRLEPIAPTSRLSSSE